MRTVSHLDLAAVSLFYVHSVTSTTRLTLSPQMNPFISFCLYVASRVFVQYLKSRPKDTQVRSSLQFLLSAMHAIKRKNPLTESFLVQLDVDLEGAGLEDTTSLRATIPFQTERETGCPFSMRGDGSDSRQQGFAYGDQGVAVYNNPNGRGAAVVPPQPVTTDSFGYNNNLEMSDLTTAYGLPSRQRTSASMQSGNYRSPSDRQHDMDTSPDASGHDQNTPSSSSLHNTSSHTSHTGYSPHTADRNINQVPHSTDMDSAQNVYDSSNTNLTTSFDMHSFPATTTQSQESGFILPADWGSTGLTPGMGTGLTPGVSTGMTPGPELLGMSDAEWQQMMEGFANTNGESSWTTATTVESNERIDAMLAARR